MSLNNQAKLPSMLQLIDNSWCTAKTFWVKLQLQKSGSVCLISQLTQTALTEMIRATGRTELRSSNTHTNVLYWRVQSDYISLPAEST